MQALTDLIEVCQVRINFLIEHWLFVLVVIAVYVGYLRKIHREG